MTENPKRTSLILHGHFYQPPRENPFTGIIAKQSSAAPYSDWNERIFTDCYEANLHSRYLNADGRIISITNNFSYISYNFGPTLLSWMNEKHPEAIGMLKEADKASVKRLGHGNAMAQSYNHTILPLDKLRDARLQIEWGAMDFERNFGRKAEGMWLPECGVNKDVIQLLADEGMKFVILSPWQCRAVEDENGKMTVLSGKPAPYWQPYILTGTNGGTIAAFFYHPGLAESISFGHALRSADNLYQTLLGIKKSDKKALIHTATDGEIYGHHEPYGDMALAALIRKVEERDDFVFDNYASFLERNPAVRHAELHQGEESRGTSWSCSHGVSRWYKDCGCHTGGDEGWNQAWRTPLRNALTHLGEKLDSVFSDEIKKIFGTSVKPEDILHLAGKEFIGELSMREFIELLHKEYGFASSYDVELAHLLSGIKNKHFSFTSCGFFFSDISGIEPRQDIKYALYAIKMFQPYSQGDLLFPFLSELRHAKSNIKAQGDGMNIAQEEMKGLPGEAEASLYFFLNRTLARKEDWMNSYGRFVLAHMDIDEAENYSSDIIDTVTLELYRFTVLSSSSIDNGINLYLCENDQDNNPVNRLRITNQDIPDRMLDEIYTWLDRSMTRVTFSELSELANDMRFFSMLVKNSRYVPLETMVLENLGLTLKIIKALFSSHSDMDIFRRREILGNMIDFIRKCGRDSDIASINSILSAHSERLAAAVNEKGLDDTISDAIIDLLDLARAHGFEPVTKNLQNAVYPYYSGQKKAECGNEKLRNTTLALNFQ